MGHFKEIFKILLVLQILSHALASYGHPDAELIDFGTDPSRDQSIIEAAIKRGMDGNAVAELLRTKQPVVKVVRMPNGVTKTTTYKLEDDGSISAKTLTQTRKQVVYNSDSIPDDLRNSPSGTVTRTYTDENGNRVTQTLSMDKPKPSTRTFTRPYGNRRTEQSWPSVPDLNDAEVIDFGTDPSRDQSIIEAAIQRGMDGSAVAELLRTKQPVVKVVRLPNGVTKTTTYKLENDGSISAKTITQTRRTAIHNSDSMLDDVLNSPYGPVTPTYTNENAHKVTQTFYEDKPMNADDRPFLSAPRTYTRVYTVPTGDRRTEQSRSSVSDFNEPITTSSQAKPITNYHRTVTRTYTGSNGERRVTQTSSNDPDDTDFHSLGSDRQSRYGNNY